MDKKTEVAVKYDICNSLGSVRDDSVTRKLFTEIAYNEGVFRWI